MIIMYTWRLDTWRLATWRDVQKIMRSLRALGPLLAPLLLSTAVAAFTCDDGRILPDDQVNDDYCDCGTDEPQTGACPNTLFKCACAPHRPVEIFASRVNDGVCDCCDGTDEFKTPGACPNTCVTLAAAELVQRSRAALNRAQRESLGARQDDQLHAPGLARSVRGPAGTV